MTHNRKYGRRGRRFVHAANGEIPECGRVASHAKKPKKKKQQRQPGAKPSVLVMLDDLPQLRDLARDHKITVNVKDVRCSRNKFTVHVMFNQNARRILDWWPGTGRFWCGMTGEKGLAANCWEALDKAAEIAAVDQIEGQ